MSSPPKTLCAKCFNSLTTKAIACHICRAKFHVFCVELDDKACNFFKEHKNIVFNCNDCLKASSEMISLISSLSSELREIKQTFISTLIKDVKELKLGFNVLAKNHDKSKNKQNKNKNLSIQLANANKQNNNNNADQRSLADVIVGSSNVLINEDNDDASSITSYAAAVSEVASNMYETDNQTSGFTKVRRRKRKNRVLAVGDNNTNELDVVVNKKYVHVSSFKPSVTADKMIEYICKSSTIEKHHIECTRLTKKDVDVNTLKHVNFKLGVSPNFYEDIIKPSLWPKNIKIRPFIFFPKKTADLLNAS